jgi:flagellar M-ring protein FliF
MADWKEQSLQVWRKLTKKQQYSIIGAAVLLMVAILGWSYWWGSKPEMVPLYTKMETKDAGDVAAKLKEMKIEYEAQEDKDGTTILVQPSDVHQARLDLATQGLPRGNKGFEIFDDSKLGVTEFQNKINYLQALQGELTRTIEQINEVDKARVHIVLPEDSLYKKNEKPATASVMLTLRGTEELPKKQIKGIVNLVAHSVQGLTPENITIVDGAGQILNEPDDDKEEQKKLGSLTVLQMNMTKKVQERLQNDLQTFLNEVLGEGKAVARVNVELDFDQRSTDRQLFEPVVDEAGIVRSSQESNESYSGTSANPGGVAGTTTNIPGYVETNGNTESQYERSETTRNYEINETKEKVVAAPGSIKRLTVAVLVDDSMTQEQQDSILRAASSAIGFNNARGDTISVEPLPFSTEMRDKIAREEQEQKDREDRILYIAIGAIVLLIAVVIGILLYRRRQQRIAREAEELAIREEMEAREREEAAMLGAAAAAQTSADDMTEEQKQHVSEREAIVKMAKSNPFEVAQLVKSWLEDE